MPIIDVTFGPRVSTEDRDAAMRMLPAAVSVAVASADEPYDGQLRPGDVILRTHEPRPSDRLDLDILIEVHSKWLPDRAVDRQRRADQILHAVQAAVGSRTIGVNLSLPVAAWAQTD